MSWISYLFPQTIARFSTPHNDDIRILEEQGKLKLLVNGSRQSGPYVENLWRKALKNFDVNEKKQIKDILVLGVAGGTVIKLLINLFPDAYITGVEIDEKMIEIGQQYFGLATVLNLNIIHTDAAQYVKKNKNSYDLIISDVFIGGHIPDFVLNQKFIEELRERLKDGGVVIINYLRELEYQAKSEIFESRLRKEFKQVKDYQIARNIFFFGAS